MIARILLFIKHRLPWLWAIVDWLNTVLYRQLHQQRMQRQVDKAFEEFKLEGFEFRPLVKGDLDDLESLIERQGEDRLQYFQPHRFDQMSLQQVHDNPAFLMFGVWDGQGTMVGYFFLRCFWNRRCFVGRLIDQPSEGKGIGRVMNQIMYHSAWWSGFRCMTTISKHNQAVMRSHHNNPHARILGELGNNYLLVEFTSQPGGKLSREGLS